MLPHPHPELPAAHKKTRGVDADPTGHYWAMDEVHFQQHGSRGPMGVPREVKDPIHLHD